MKAGTTSLYRYLQAHPEIGAVFSMDHYIDDHGTIFGHTRSV